MASGKNKVDAIVPSNLTLLSPNNFHLSTCRPSEMRREMERLRQRLSELVEKKAEFDEFITQIELCCNNLLNEENEDIFNQKKSVQIDQIKKLILMLGSVYDRIPSFDLDDFSLLSSIGSSKKPAAEATKQPVVASFTSAANFLAEIPTTTIQHGAGARPKTAAIVAINPPNSFVEKRNNADIASSSPSTSAIDDLADLLGVAPAEILKPRLLSDEPNLNEVEKNQCNAQGCASNASQQNLVNAKDLFSDQADSLISDSDAYPLKFPTLQKSQDYNVIVAVPLSPSIIWCQPIDTNVEQTNAHLNNLYRNRMNIDEEFIRQATAYNGQSLINTLVAAPYKHSDSNVCYYRALVRKVAEIDFPACLVYYVDYGNQEWVSLQTLRPLPEEFRKLGAQCFPTKIWNLAPLDGRKWTETECSIFTDILCRFVGNEAINAKCIDTEPSGVSYVMKFQVKNGDGKLNDLGELLAKSGCGRIAQPQEFASKKNLCPQFLPCFAMENPLTSMEPPTFCQALPWQLFGFEENDTRIAQANLNNLNSKDFSQCQSSTAAQKNTQKSHLLPVFSIIERLPTMGFEDQPGENENDLLLQSRNFESVKIQPILVENLLSDFNYEGVTSYDLPPGFEVAQRISAPEFVLSAAGCINFFVTEIQNPAEFLVHVVDQKKPRPTQLIQTLSDCLAKKYTDQEISRATRIIPTMVRPEMLVVVRRFVSMENFFYRAQIKSFEQRERKIGTGIGNSMQELSTYVNVLLIDEGIHCSILLSDDVWLMSNEFSAVPRMAVRCQLYDIHPVHGEWSEQDLNSVKQIISQDQTYRATVLDSVEPLKIVLESPYANGKNSVNEWLVSKGIATSASFGGS